jgi:hypothetical protein
VKDHGRLIALAVCWFAGLEVLLKAWEFHAYSSGSVSHGGQKKYNIVTLTYDFDQFAYEDISRSVSTSEWGRFHDAKTRIRPSYTTECRAHVAPAAQAARGDEGR